jgi:hypothetical protein
MVRFTVARWHDVVDCPVFAFEVFATDGTDRFE